MIGTTVAITYVATKFLDQFIKEEGYGRLKLFFFPKDRYYKRLLRLISDVTDEYAAKDPVKYQDKISFYHSPVVFKMLSNHVLFKEANMSEVNATLEKNPNVLKPSAGEVNKFFELFYTRAKANPKLKKIFIEEHYKPQIFEISAAVDRIEKHVENTSAEITQIKSQLDTIVDQQQPIQRPVITSDYLPSPEEDKLEKLLADKEVLLLSGVSFCGKSQLAKTIAERFIQNGYRYQGGADVGDADRFLRNPGGKHIFLLEDPFGHNIESESKVNLRKVQELLKNKTPGNKIIITTRSEVLTGANGVATVDDCALEGNNWIELKFRGRAFLEEAWGKMSHAVPENCKGLINKYLNTAPEHQLLQIGQLAHLGRLPGRSLEGKSLEILLHLAQADAKQLAIDIKARGKVSSKLYKVLGLAASTIVPVRLEDLAYILAEDDQCPAFLKEQTFKRSKRSNQVSFPKYQNEYTLNPEDRTELTFFIERGYIQLNQNEITFRHPTYQEASKYLLTETPVLEVKESSEKVKRTLASLNTNSATYIASQLSSIYDATNQEGLKAELLDVAYQEATNSIFPSVRDWVLKFLLEHISANNEQVQEGIYHLIDEDMSSSDIFWSGNTPFYSDCSRSFFEEDEYNEAETKAAIADLSTDKEQSSLTLWSIVNLLSRHDFPVTDFPNKEGILQILNAPETFIRSTMANIVLKRTPALSANIIDQIFSDPNPWVVVEGIKGTILGYPHHSQAERERLVQLIQKSLNNNFVIARIRTFLSSFGIDYGIEHIDWENIEDQNKQPMWELWGDIFPTFMENMPINVEINNSGRFDVTLNESKKYLKNTEAGFRVAEAFYKWVDNRVSAGKFLDTYEMGIVSFLLDIVDDHQKRLPLFQKILQYPKTNLMLYSVSWAISDWEILSGAEKQIILDLFSSGRIDQRWIIATAITRSHVPTEIQQLIFGKDDFLDLPPNEIIAKIPSQLLSDALEIFIGQSHLISGLGISHTRNEKWQKIIEEVLKNGLNPNFELCLGEFILHVINGPAREWSDNYKNIWKTMCAQESLLDQLSDALILENAKSNPSIPPSTYLWQELIFAYTQAGEVDRLADKVIVVIEALQRFEADDIIEFFKGEFMDCIVNRCPLDLCILSVLVAHSKTDLIPIEVLDELAEEVKKLSVEHNIRLEISIDFIKKMVPKLIGHPAHEVLTQLSNKIYEIGTAWVHSHRYEKEINGWIS
ncbi:hypothetical protein EV200_101193 [Pedobacter psychrotolerans]|uniref:Novel STAND NTPase 3 domain-containing protein n=2 Tax=Pedobacter psychrotolerans TaxID=1843235 RepID=A0A4R2HM01_9SPHI|nr:hypothetical protein EV200_101193 [Pedobacter psychrotolerans]GGE44685.1 hypothetical protein GCM10011413_08500 [Pedobacter psychrotolerans]